MPCNGIVEERRRYNGSIPCRENKGLYDNEQSPSAQYGVVLKGKGAFITYHIEKELGTDPPKWTVYFKANQADALTAAFKEYTKKDLTRSTRPSLLTQLHKFKELAQSLGRDRVKNKEHGGPER